MGTPTRSERESEPPVRTPMVGGRWMPLHPFRGSTWESVKAVLGAIILLGILAAFLLQYLGLLSPR